MNAERLAQLLLDGLNVQKDEGGAFSPYVDGDDLTDACIDGDVNLVALAQFVLDNQNGDVIA